MHSSIPLIKGINLINSPTGGGKSTVAISIACEWLKGGGRVFYLHHEESIEDMYMGFYACNHGIPLRLLREGLYMHISKTNPESLISEFSKLCLRNRDVRNEKDEHVRMLSIADCVRSFDFREGDLLVVDYLSKIDPQDRDFLLSLASKAEVTIALFCPQPMLAPAKGNGEKLNLDSLMLTNDGFSGLYFHSSTKIRVFGILIARHKSSYLGSDDSRMLVTRVDNIPLHDGYQSEVTKYFVSHANLQCRSTLITCMELTPEAWLKLRERLITLK